MDDFAAELGFWIDVMGLQVNALGAEYGQFSSPGGEFCIAIAQAPAGGFSTPANSIRVQISVKKLSSIITELTRRSIQVHANPFEGTANFATFLTPHGIAIELCGDEELPALEKAQALIGYAPRHGLDDILVQVIDYFRKK